MSTDAMRNLLFILLLCCPAGVTWAEPFVHRAWDNLLSTHVQVIQGGQATTVDYSGMARDRPQLKLYLDQLARVSRVTFDQWSREEQLAWLINAYNAWTVELVLTGFPTLDSIKDLGSLLRSPWRRSFIPLLGETRSLDDIEHGLIRGSGRYHEPRIHFAVNCASIGCPALRNEAYRAARLERQLQSQTAGFLADRSRNYLDGDTLRVSPIFKWYRDDFEQGWRGAESLGQFLSRYSNALALSAADSDKLRRDEMAVRFLSYDWDLNDSSR